MNITGWELLDRIVAVGSLLVMLWQLYENRTRVWTGLKWGSVKTFGVVFSFLGSTMGGALIVALWNFPRPGTFYSGYGVVPFAIGVGIGAGIWGWASMVILGLGIWAIAPRSRFTSVIKKQVFRLKPSEERKRAQTAHVWGHLRRRVPAASILRA